MRELEEELGVSKPIEDFKLLTQFSYQDNRTHVWGNVFHIKLDHEAKDLKLQVEEVKAVEYWTKDQILAKIEEQKQESYKGPLMTPDGVKAF